MRFLVLGFAILSFGLGLQAQTWSSWHPDPVFHGIEVRERCTGFNEFASAYVWDVELRNTYQGPIDLTWAVDPELLHGAAAQTDHAIAVKPGEIVDARHSVTQDCNASLPIRVSNVQASTSTGVPTATPAGTRTFEGRWTSKDPDPFKKQVVVQLSGNTVTGTFSSPSVSFQVSTPLPEVLDKLISTKDDRNK